NSNGNTPALKLVNIGFFNPGKKFTENLNIVDDGKTFIYINVFTFTDKLKYIVNISPNGEA
ncbi:hypothetical protein QBC39DRAFT_247663, partial [Podospora conica]